MKQDIDRIKQSLEDGLEVYQDIKKALEDDNKVSWMEGGTLVVKHGGKAIRLITSLKEIGEEVKDLDSAEASEIVELITEEFGGSTEANEAIKKIASGAASMNQGIQELIKLKK